MVAFCLLLPTDNSFQVLALTTDNTASNDTLTLEFKRLVHKQCMDSMFSAESGHVGCLAHIINLTAKDFIKKH